MYTLLKKTINYLYLLIYKHDSIFSINHNNRKHKHFSNIFHSILNLEITREVQNSNFSLKFTRLVLRTSRKIRGGKDDK